MVGAARLDGLVGSKSMSTCLHLGDITFRPTLDHDFSCSHLLVDLDMLGRAGCQIPIGP